MSWVWAVPWATLQCGRGALSRRGLTALAGKKKHGRGRAPWSRRKGAVAPPPRNFCEDVELTAQIERVTFHNAENGYSVVRA
eukprot:SAG11_NODE_14544_length_608_cov_1.096267_1_plen_81_part_10